jgi:HSP20 family protein
MHVTQLMPVERNGATERRDPLGALELVTNRMRRTLEQTLGDLGWPTAFGIGAWTPAVDVEEGDDVYIVEAELPGVTANEVTIELTGSELVIAGEVGERERFGRLRRQMRRTGRFDCRIELPGELDADAAEARLADGLLTVRVPRAEHARRRTIEVAT